MINGKTKSGIKFTINEKIGDDMRVALLIAEAKKAAKEDKDAMEQMEPVVKLLELIFGDGMMNFMDAVASTHDGICDAKSMVSELMEIFEAVNLKNSSSSQK